MPKKESKSIRDMYYYAETQLRKNYKPIYWTVNYLYIDKNENDSVFIPDYIFTRKIGMENHMAIAKIFRKPKIEQSDIDLMDIYINASIKKSKIYKNLIIDDIIYYVPRDTDKKVMKNKKFHGYNIICKPLKNFIWKNSKLTWLSNVEN